MSGVLLTVGQTLLIVALAPLWPGVVAALKARLQMRRGAPVLQRYRDLARLAGKETVISDDASWLARLAPAVALGCAITAASWTPVLLAREASGLTGDLLLTVGVLAALRLVLALLAMECGTSFGGMAASRHLALSALAEPALILSGFTVAMAASSTDLGRISGAIVASPAAWMSPSHLLALAAMAMVAIAELGRVPVDNPATHLELTMIHEGLVLDLSGRHLLLVSWASYIRQLVLLTLVLHLFLPWGIAASPSAAGLALALVAWLAKLAALALAVAVLESVTAKMRLFRVPEFLGLAFLLSLLALASDALMR